MRRAGGARSGLPVRWMLLALLVLVPFGAFIAVRVGAERATERARRAIIGAGIDPEALRAQQTNATALELDRLARAIGLPPVPYSRPTGGHRVRLAGEGLDCDMRHVTSYGLVVSEPIVDWLARHAATLDEIERLLDEREPPRWDRATPIDHDAILHVETVLLKRAMLSPDAAGRERSLRASWKLGSSQLPAREAEHHIDTMHLFAAVAAVLREEDVDIERWLILLEATELEDATSSSLRSEVVLNWEGMREIARAPVSLGYPPPRIVRRAERVDRWCRPCLLARLGASVEEQISLLGRLESMSPCADPAPWLAARAGSAPARFGRLTHLRYASAWSAMRRLQIELELTRRVLLIRRMRRDGTLPGPGPIDLGPTSLPCAKLAFRSEVLPNGRAIVEFEGAASWSVGGAVNATRRWEEAEVRRHPRDAVRVRLDGRRSDEWWQ